MKRVCKSLLACLFEFEGSKFRKTQLIAPGKEKTLTVIKRFSFFFSDKLRLHVCNRHSIQNILNVDKWNFWIKFNEISLDRMKIVKLLT